MNIEKSLATRSNNACELCGASNPTKVYTVPPAPQPTVDDCVFICPTCHNQIVNPETMDANHWRSLNETMWSEVPVVKVMVWRMLNRLGNEGWPLDLLDMLYLDDETSKWARATGEAFGEEKAPKHVDSNGTILQSGDTVTLIQTLDVKGSTMDAKRGTPVKNIKLVEGNHEQIEGKVNGQQLVILTKFVKKA